WAGFDQAYPRCKVVLPTYPFQRQRHWIEASHSQANGLPNQNLLAHWLGNQTIEGLTESIIEKGQLDPTARAIVTQVLTTLDTERHAQQMAAQVESLLYEVAWERQPKSLTVTPPAIPGRWLVLADERGVGVALRDRLANLGETVELVQAATDFAEITAYLTATDQDVPRLRGVIHLWGLNDSLVDDLSTLQQSQERNLGSVLALVQQLASHPDPLPRLWIVTQGAQQLAATAGVAVTQTPLWGLGRVIALEHSELWGGLVDLDCGEPLAMAQTLLAELLQHRPDGETQVAYRQGVRYVARLVRGKLKKGGPRPISIHAGARYLVTGGLGGLGLRVANWLVEQGAKHLVLTGRQRITNEIQQATVNQLEAQGVTVQLAQVDVANETAMRRLFEGIEADGIPLKGVFHTAGVLDDGVLLNQSWARFATVLAAKVWGGWLLDQLTRTMDLDVMIFFSSATSLLGQPGQGNYAAANAFLDGLARQRQQRGLPGISINWGGWAESGMVARTTQTKLASDQILAPAVGLAALGQLLNRGGQMGVLPIDWTQAGPLASQPQPFLVNFIALQPVTKLTSSLVQTLAALPANHRLDYLRDYLQQAVGAILGLADLPDRATGFAHLGVDSLMAMELRRQLERASGHTLPPTVAFEYPTINALASYLLNDVLALAESRASEITTPHGQFTQGLNEPIAVISLACRFPGADTPEAFWQLLQDGVDRVQEIPRTRWNVDDYYDRQRPTRGKMYTRAAALLDDVAQFDPGFFGISPREATGMDPHHRLLLEVSWETLERAGLAQHTLVDSQTGVFVGIGQSDYGLFNSTHDVADLDIHSGTSGGHSVAAGRLAYTLGLQGPTMAVDTACSSSLVALHLACQSLRMGECDLALAGGVNLILSPTAHVELSQMQALSADGRCKTFAATADGYGRGEGCGMVALKRLSDAEADGDTILAVIKGSAVNHDGLSSGLTVPNKLAQEKLLRQSLSNAQVTPDEISYIEAHGTGTPLGDPIELRALDAVFGQRATPLLVGSVKTNIGHLEAAAGIAGFVKTVLALHHGQIPAHLHFDTPNPHVAWDEFAISVPTTQQPWPMAQRVAGVSAFGFSGTNAHIIVAAAPLRVEPTERQLEAPSPQLLPLSAKTEPALAALVARYLDHLRIHPELTLNDLCYGSMVGRNHFDHRLGIVATDRSDLQSKLLAIQASEDRPGVLRGNVSETSPRIAFLFTGQGSQYVDMGRELYEAKTPAGAIFRSTLDQCDVVLQEHLDKSLLSILYPVLADTPQVEENSIAQTTYTQPALFALEYALAAVWQAWGIQPSFLLGHSVGELAAACVAGVFSLADGLKLAALRGRLMGALPQDGEMVAVLADEAQVQQAIASYYMGTELVEVAIAAINGPDNIVISGRSAAVQAIVAQLTAAGVKTRPLTVSHAFHSPLMDPILAEFQQVAASITYHPPKLRLVSNVTGKLAGDEVSTPEYWVRHIRAAVRFADGVATLHEHGATIFLEIGPKPTLLGMAEQCVNGETEREGDKEKDSPLLPFSPSPCLFLPSLREKQADWAQMVSSLGQLYVQGVAIDWAGVAQAEEPHKVLLPTYPFQRQRYWIDSESVRQPSLIKVQGQATVANWLATLNVEQLTQQITNKFNGSTSTPQLIAQVLAALQAKHQAEANTKTLAAYLYEVTWQPQSPAVAELASTTSKRWLLLADQRGVGVALAQRLQAVGQQVTLLYQTDATTQSTSQLAHDTQFASEEISVKDLGLFQQRLQELLGQDAVAWRGIVHLWALNSTHPADQTVDAILQGQKVTCGALLHLLQARGQVPALATGAPIWVVTRGAELVQGTGAAASVDPNQSTLWGMGRVISLEHPEWWGGLIDLDPASADEVEAAATAIWQEIVATSGEEQVAYRQGQRYVARLTAAQPAISAKPLVIQRDGAYLISGGLGGIGLHTARWLAEQGAGHLILTGRRGVQSEEQRVVLAELRAKGVTVTVAEVDVADEAGMTQLFREIVSAGVPLRGVIHAAGVLGIKAIRALQWDDFVAMMRPKVMGGWLLHQLTQTLDLDFFIGYASGAGIWGGKDHAHYGAANHFLDGLMAYRRSQALPGLSIAWGPWAEGGMATPEAQGSFAALGVRAFAPQQGLAIQRYLLETDASQMVAADVEWSRLKSLYELTKPRRFLAEITTESSATEANANDQREPEIPGKAALVQALEALPVNRRLEQLRSYLQQTVGAVLGMAELRDRTTGFADLGLDSLMAIELRQQLQRGLQHPLPTTIAFEYPTINALADYLLDEVLALAEFHPTEEPTPVRQIATGINEPIAVISLACRFPGADTPEAFWQLLQDGVDRVQEIPRTRWNVDDYYNPRPHTHGKMYTRA
ncbi:MAG: SDR family NAD(P)-dependent oxidoreductase, partial [Chloroflexi bacterium]|nr:SDR family NAD(P)-dependent oxidoreductase [Chloroflexota bacterium]